MKNFLATACVVYCVATSTKALAQAERFEGIWRDERQPDSYFSLHIEADQVVLIDLASVERTGESLAASYRGQLGLSPTGTPKASVKVIQRHPDTQGSAEIFPDGPDKLHIAWCYQPEGGCIVGILTTITKVF